MAWIFLWVLLMFLLCITVYFAFRNSHLFQRLGYPNPDLSLLLIVRDQASIIEGVVKELLAYYQSSPRSFELVVIDDGSSDETPEILRCLHRKHDFTLVFGQQSLGLKALDSGFAVCQGKMIHYFLLTERVGLRTVTSLARCLSRGERIPNFGVTCTPGVMSGTATQ